MIKVKKIKLYGFKNSFSTAQVDLIEDSYSVIYGENGCGKTTFLKIFQAILSENEEILLNEEIDRAEITFSCNNIEKTISIKRTFKPLNFEKYNQNQILITPLEESSNHYNWTEFHNSELSTTKSISLGVDRGYPSPRINASRSQISRFINSRRSLRTIFSDKMQVERFCDELSNFLSSRNRPNNSLSALNEDHLSLTNLNMGNVGETLLSRYRSGRRKSSIEIQNALFETLSTLIIKKDQKPQKKTKVNDSNFEKEIFQNKDLIIEALLSTQDNQLAREIIQKLSEIKTPNDTKEIKENQILKTLLLKMASALKDSESELFAINTIIDTFDKYTSNGKSLYIGLDGVEITTPFGNHSIEQLSSGERHILTLLTVLLDQGEDKNFVIIDEPEISLNTNWQRVLLDTLGEILPHSQIIVASHSPIIAQSIKNLAKLEVSADL